jgi:hypothetical protein
MKAPKIESLEGLLTRLLLGIISMSSNALSKGKGFGEYGA